METYIAMLRGINVSGQKAIPMKELAGLCESLGLQQVQTYIQSGNVLFRAEAAEAAALATRIAEKIQAHYQFHVPVIIRRARELQAALNRNPFLQAGDAAADKLHMTFLAEPPGPEQMGQITGDYAPDQYYIDGQEVFLYCPQGYGRTRLNNTFWENKLGVTATTRNLKTVRQLVSMAAADD